MSQDSEAHRFSLQRAAWTYLIDKPPGSSSVKLQWFEDDGPGCECASVRSTCAFGIYGCDQGEGERQKYSTVRVFSLLSHI